MSNSIAVGTRVTWAPGRRPTGSSHLKAGTVVSLREETKYGPAHMRASVRWDGTEGVEGPLKCLAELLIPIDMV